jgi:hypothetical protein
MVPETVEALSVACQRAFFVTLAASVSVALIIAVQTFKLSEEQHLIEKKQVSLESIHGVARIVASDLNFRLLQDYAEAQDDADAIHSLLSDVLSSRTALLSLRNAIAEDRNMETERRVDLNTKLNKLLVVFQSGRRVFSAGD